MEIKSLNLRHYRIAKNLELEFHPRLNVFCGVNGCGKSTILNAAVVMLSWLTKRIETRRATARTISVSDITNTELASMIDIELQSENNIVNWRMVKYRKGLSTGAGKSNYTSLNEYTSNTQAQMAFSEGGVNLPLFVFYPVSRAVLDIPLRIKNKHEFDQLSAYEGSLTSGANFRTFFEWFREREDLENESRKYVDDATLSQEYQFPDPQLEAVRSALEAFMPDFSDLTVRRNPLRMEVKKAGARLTVNQLSDGEKCLMAMVGDLARRMAIANPFRDNPLLGDGVVLIDEIDLHLHPKWQRMIVPRLTEVFPNCQFILSTHSPHVLTHVNPESLFLLKEDGGGITAEHPPASYGKTVVRILEDLMGLNTTRPDEVSDRLSKLFVAIDNKQLTQAKRLVSEIRGDIGEDSDLVKADVLISRKEIIGK